MKTIKNILRVIASNVFVVLSGLFVSFLLPKIMSLTDYGLYKKFTLYSNYLGVLSIGIIDGIVLKYGGVNYEELNRKSFRSYFLWYTLITLFFSAAAIIIALFVGNRDFKFITISLALYLIAYNITGYYQQISQITQRFKEYSNRKIIQSLFTIAIIGVLYIFYRQGTDITYSLYVILFVVINYILTFWYLHTYREISFGEAYTLKETLQDIKGLVMKGFPLLIANLCTLLILSLDRQFVSVLFSNEQYATYAFAYSMLSLVTVATSAISTVLYPLLKRMDIELLKVRFTDTIGVVLSLVFFVCICFYPLTIFINWFLPNYTESLKIFEIILPGIAFSSAITVVLQNYYKVFDLAFNYFLKSVIALVLSGVFNGVAYVLFRSREAISIASIITMIIWYLIVDIKIEKACKSNGTKNFLYLLLCMGIFYGSNFCNNPYIAFCIYLILYFAVTLLFQKKSLETYFSEIKNK